ncbi:MAG TPA: hypothetical protein PLE19_17595 [Planctomycetota bacterium]|nr:hypothetical protein [Planctomycetota bacterium]HRR80757.1 hypothetical protein [Planctomycetota bacterium]HRT94396.1 hypothetical protein [Planctomycetota bacterium]
MHWRAAWALLLSGAALATAAEVTATLRPAFDGRFRPTAPLLVWVTLSNAGPAVDGTLDVAVEGVAFRQRVRLGAGASATLGALVAARSEAARARIVVRSGRGDPVCEQMMPLGLRRRAPAEPVVAAVVDARAAVPRLCGEAQPVVVTSAELPTLAAAYGVLDAVAVAGDGGELAKAERAALAAWVRGGGAVGFALDDSAPVRTDSLAAELGDVAGRPTAREWLAALRDKRPGLAGDGHARWHVGLGTVAVAVGEAGALKASDWFSPRGERGNEWADKGLYEAFRGARWTSALRWRLVGGASALLALGALLATLAARRRGRAVGSVLVFGVAGAAAAATWALMLPEGRGMLEAACVLERSPEQPGERRTELLCLEALGRTRVRLDFGLAEAVLPFYHGAEEPGGNGGEAIVERDEAGRWTVECDLTRRSRRCFAAWWPWRDAAEGGAGDPEGNWLSEARQGVWGAEHQALAAWQARRAGAARPFRVAPLADWRSAVAASGVLQVRHAAAQAWWRAAD